MPNIKSENGQNVLNVCPRLADNNILVKISGLFQQDIE